MDKLGVIIARFQVPYLHDGHRYLLNLVQDENERVLVILGYSGGEPTQHDPMDFETRKALIQGEYPNARVLRVRDVRDDKVWSQRVDYVIESFGTDDVTLYGGPDSFIPHYLGPHKTKYVEIPVLVHGKELRARINGPLVDRQSQPFREGMIYAANIRRPVSYQTVDIAIIKDWTNPQYILMGLREGDDGLRLPGGFVDPLDESLEVAAKREAYEETNGMGLDGFEYLGSFRIADWRYRNAPDKVMTALYLAWYQFGSVETIADDFEGARWVPIDDLSKVVASLHKPLAERVLQFGPLNETARKIAAHREEQRAAR